MKKRRAAAKQSTSAAKKAARRTPPRVGEMRAEYDFSGGVRGKYARDLIAGSNVVVLAPDVAAEFPNSAAVNRALRAYLKVRATRRSA